MPVDLNALRTENPEAYSYILELRGEAAEHRVKANEAVARATTAETERDRYKANAEAATAKVEELTAKTGELTERDWRKAAQDKYGLSDAQAARLRGDSAETFLADAEQYCKDNGIKVSDEEGETAPSSRPPADSALSQEPGNLSGIGPDPENEAFVQKLMAVHGLAGADNA